MRVFEKNSVWTHSYLRTEIRTPDRRRSKLIFKLERFHHYFKTLNRIINEDRKNVFWQKTVLERTARKRCGAVLRRRSLNVLSLSYEASKWPRIVGRAFKGRYTGGQNYRATR